MNFAAHLLSIIALLIANIICYIITFTDNFALTNKEMYGIISIFNDFIFITCVLSGITSLRKAKFNTTIVFFSIPLIYTSILWYFFR